MAAWSRSRVSLDEDDRVHASRAGAGAVLDAPFTRSLAGCARERGVPSATPGKLWKSVRPFRQFSNSRRDRSSRCSPRAGLSFKIPVPRSCSCATPRPVLHSKIPILAQDFNFHVSLRKRSADGIRCRPAARVERVQAPSARSKHHESTLGDPPEARGRPPVGRIVVYPVGHLKKQQQLELDPPVPNKVWSS